VAVDGPDDYSSCCSSSVIHPAAHPAAHPVHCSPEPCCIPSRSAAAFSMTRPPLRDNACVLRGGGY